MQSTTQRKPTQYESLLAGIVAGALEGAVTYPAEYLKTRGQFAARKGQAVGPITMLGQTLRNQGLKGLYSGAGALIVGNGLKAGVRFMSYDTIKEMLRSDDGRLTPARTMLAGLGAGAIEAAVAVTPSETIKTKLIQDATSGHPRYTNMVNGTIGICRSEGFGGIYRGLAPTIMKQAANSAVRFTSFATLQQAMLDWSKPPSGKLSSTVTFGLGAIAGVITVYATMPLDNVKTRMQSLEARTRYRHSLHCFTSIIRAEGVQRLWGGSTLRLVRLMISGGLIFTVYERLVNIMVSL